ncbi:hypothetical protein PL11201_80440 [Planktothrix sp. PCC 11201]|nr:hypothetical protein PL11201_80440 [Planktothrix sp. PCC 11201]
MPQSRLEKRVLKFRRDLQRMRTLCQELNRFVIKSTRDGLSMYFSSAIQAVNCAI